MNKDVEHAASQPPDLRVSNFLITLGICAIALAAFATTAALRDNAQPAAQPDNRAAIVQAPDVAPGDEPASEEVSNAETGAAVLDLAGLEEQPDMVVAQANRGICDEIRGTPYLSEAERAWFLASCSAEPGPVFAAAGFSGVLSQASVSVPTPAPGVSAAAAIALSTEWIANQPGPSYRVPDETCTATRVGSLWLVSCQTSLIGCQDGLCTSWVSVCVTDADGAVVPGNRC